MIVNIKNNSMNCCAHMIYFFYAAPSHKWPKTKQIWKTDLAEKSQAWWYLCGFPATIQIFTLDWLPLGYRVCDWCVFCGGLTACPGHLPDFDLLNAGMDTSDFLFGIRCIWTENWGKTLEGWDEWHLRHSISVVAINNVPLLKARETQMSHKVRGSVGGGEKRS